MLIICSLGEEYVPTWPATASPSARRDVASQICKQTWNAAMDVEPWRAASDAARVTQNVTATTLINNRKPVKNKKLAKGVNCATMFQWD